MCLMTQNAFLADVKQSPEMWMENGNVIQISKRKKQRDHPLVINMFRAYNNGLQYFKMDESICFSLYVK